MYKTQSKLLLLMQKNDSRPQWIQFNLRPNPLVINIYYIV
jgi:hypothetical protein